MDNFSANPTKNFLANMAYESVASAFPDDPMFREVIRFTIPVVMKLGGEINNILDGKEGAENEYIFRTPAGSDPRVPHFLVRELPDRVEVELGMEYYGELLPAYMFYSGTDGLAIANKILNHEDGEIRQR